MSAWARWPHCERIGELVASERQYALAENRVELLRVALERLGERLLGLWVEGWVGGLAHLLELSQAKLRICGGIVGVALDALLELRDHALVVQLDRRRRRRHHINGHRRARLILKGCASPG